MKKVKVALLGLGTIGQGVYTNIRKQEETLKRLLGKKVKITAVLIQNNKKERHIDANTLVTSSIEEVLATKPHVVIEAMGGIQPTLEYIEKSLANGCHVISANKDLIARHGTDIYKKANENNVSFIYEASVGGGIPLIRTIKDLLQFNHIERVEAILNGTNNFILTHMRTKNIPFLDALEVAKEHGYAEPDPTNDIEGYDAFYKAMVLSQLIYGKQPKWDDVLVEGITAVQLDELLLAESMGFRLKQLVTLDDSLHIKIQSQFIDNQHPLFGVEGVDNAIRFKADPLGFLTLQGPGAGAAPTASAIIEDLVSLYTKKEVVPRQYKKINTLQEETVKGTSYAILFIKPNCIDYERESIMTTLHEQTTILQSITSDDYTIILLKEKESLKNLLETYKSSLSYYPANVTNENIYSHTKLEINA